MGSISMRQPEKKFAISYMKTNDENSISELAIFYKSYLLNATQISTDYNIEIAYKLGHSLFIDALNNNIIVTDNNRRLLNTKEVVMRGNNKLISDSNYRIIYVIEQKINNNNR
jgi:hypothetical protein